MEWENIKLKCISILENRERIHNRPWYWRWCLHSCFGHPWLQLYPSILDHFENSRVQGQFFLKFGIKRNWPYIHMHQKRTVEKKFFTVVVFFFSFFFFPWFLIKKWYLELVLVAVVVEFTCLRLEFASTPDEDWAWTLHHWNPIQVFG